MSRHPGLPRDPATLFDQLIAAAATDDRGRLTRYLTGIARNAWGWIVGNERGEFITSQSALQYLRHLAFVVDASPSPVGFDFRRKRILDVGAGRSRFIDVVNRVYGHTGTVAIGLDLHPFRARKAPFVRADARHLPVASGSVDVVLCNCCVSYCLLGASSRAEANAQAKTVLDELIRVTASGGQLRFNTWIEGHGARASEYLEHHPCVTTLDVYTMGARVGVRVEVFVVDIRR